MKRLGLVLALGLAVGAFVSWLPRESVLAVLRALFLAFVARGAVLAAMLLLVGESYWTGLRVLGDLPFALLWSVGTALIWAALHSVAPRSSSS